MHLYPDALSIGQRQRGTIARALAHCPALVVADEPTAALDPETADEAMRLIVEAADISGSAVLISSHDLALVARHTARGYKLALTPDRPGHVVSQLTRSAAMRPHDAGCFIGSARADPRPGQPDL